MDSSLGSDATASMLSLDLEALSLDLEALSLDLEALSLGLEALSLGLEALSLGLEALSLERMDAWNRPGRDSDCMRSTPRLHVFLPSTAWHQVTDCTASGPRLHAIGSPTACHRGGTADESSSPSSGVLSFVGLAPRGSCPGYLSLLSS